MKITTEDTECTEKGRAGRRPDGIRRSLAL
jgi:hypothetical protein